MRRLLQVLNAPGEVKGRAVMVGASIGVALVPDHGQTIDEVMGNADLALYAAKAAGRNTYRFFDLAMAESARSRVRLQQELGLALAACVAWFQGDRTERVHYTVVARSGVPGLNLKAPVKLSGVEIGKVEEIGFDPANSICTTDAHARVAIGLDYLGAAPVRGTRYGGCAETLTVDVDAVLRKNKQDEDVELKDGDRVEVKARGFKIGN